MFFILFQLCFASARRSFCAAPNPLFDRQPRNTSPEDNIFVQERLQISRFRGLWCITLRLSCLEYDLGVATGALVNERQVNSGGVAEPANLFWIKNIYCCLFKSLFNWSTHILQQDYWNCSWFLWKFYCCWDGFQLVPKYQTKVKLISNISVWNIWIAKKWKPRCTFSGFLQSHSVMDWGPKYIWRLKLMFQHFFAWDRRWRPFQETLLHCCVSYAWPAASVGQFPMFRHHPFWQTLIPILSVLDHLS